MTEEVPAISNADAATAAPASVNELATSANLTLDELASAIQAEMEKFDRKKVGLYLIYAKEIATEHGQFMEFVKTNLPRIPHRTATSWMNLAAGTPEAKARKRESANPSDSEKKRYDAALKTLVDMTTSDARRLDQSRLTTVANTIMSLALVPEPVRGSGGGALVAIAKQVLSWAAANSRPHLTDGDRAVLKQASDILATYMEARQAAAAA